MEMLDKLSRKEKKELDQKLDEFLEKAANFFAGLGTNQAMELSGDERELFRAVHQRLEREAVRVASQRRGGVSEDELADRLKEPLARITVFQRISEAGAEDLSESDRLDLQAGTEKLAHLRENAKIRAASISAATKTVSDLLQDDAAGEKIRKARAGNARLATAKRSEKDTKNAGREGGLARAKALSPKELSKIGKTGAKARWKKDK